MLTAVVRGSCRSQPLQTIQSRSLFGIGWSKKVAPVSQAMDKIAVSPLDTSKIQRNHFIPLTRRSLFRFIYQEKKLLRAEEREDFEEFAVALDNIVSRRHQELLMDLKNLFDPINPDKDTKETRLLTRRDRLDTEFFLLQRLADLMERANFRELSRLEVEAALEPHNTRVGVKVTVDLAQYDVLKLWVLGIEPATEKSSFLSRLIAYFRFRSMEIEKDVDRYKRIVLAVRMKREDKLALKLFKDIPVNSLEQLLPDGRLSMTDMDKVVVQSTVALGVGGVALKVLGWSLGFTVQWSLVISAVAAAVAGRAWGTHKLRRQAYLSRLNLLLYWHNVSNNRGLLTLIADRAEEEAFKESLLVFAFLNAAKEPMNEFFNPAQETLPVEAEGGLARAVLQSRIENWLHDRCHISGVDFDPSEAIRLLASLGVVVEEDGRFSVVASSILDVLARLPMEPRAAALSRPSPSDDEAFEGPRGSDVQGRTGWQ